MLQPLWAATTRALTADAAELFDWVTQAGDNDGLPFMIIDKRQAHLWVFDRSGKLQGNAPVLLGVARGDDTAPGVGDKKLSEIRTEERTTPAGRFLAEVGMNARGEDVVWVDYDAAVSMHRVLTTNAKEQRSRRLETPTPNDNRVSYGCINVPKAFFENVVSVTVSGGNSVVYVLPESTPLRSVFNRLATAQPNLATARQ
ncbi:MAG: L,D-transpeptidase [Burkholderiaceae bacterium]